MPPLSISSFCKSLLLPLLGIWLLLAPINRAIAVQTIVLNGEQSRVELGVGGLAYLRDPAGKLGVDEVRAAFQAGKFTSIPGNLGLGYTKDTVWLAIIVNREAAALENRVLQVEPSTLDLVELYQLSQSEMRKQLSGDSLPISRRAMAYRGPAFPLVLPEGNTMLLLRIKTSSQMTAIPFLFQAPAFEQGKATESLYFGLYFGFLLTLFAFSVINAFSVRDKVFLLYPPYLFFHLIFWLDFDGLLALHFLPENPLLVNQVLGGLLAILSVMGNYLYANLLKVGPEYKVTRFLLLICYLSGFVSFASIPLGFFALFMPGLMITTLLALPVLAPHAWRQIYSDNTEDRIFGLTYLVFGLLVVISIAMNLSLLPANLWTAYSAQFGQVFHAAALLMGMHYRFRNIRRQGEDAQSKLRDASRDIEKERSVRREQEQLLHMIGHEVRTPVSIISAAVDSLKLIDADGDTDEQAKEQRYQRIHKAIKRMEMLMQLVGAENRSRFEAHQQPMLEKLNFRDVCQDNLHLLTDNIDHIQFDVASDLHPTIHGDADMLGFLLLNLYDNALKYTVGAHLIQARLQMESRAGTPGAVFTICNRSRPFAPGMEERIFDKFIRIDESRSQPGLGLGLYLARRIAEQHGGKLVAYNSGASQVCFELWLPLYQEAEG